MKERLNCAACFLVGIALAAAAGRFLGDKPATTPTSHEPWMIYRDPERWGFADRVDEVALGHWMLTVGKAYGQSGNDFQFHLLPNGPPRSELLTLAEEATRHLPHDSPVTITVESLDHAIDGRRTRISNLLREIEKMIDLHDDLGNL